MGGEWREPKRVPEVCTRMMRGSCLTAKRSGAVFFGVLPEVSGFDNTTATLTGSRETVRRLLVAEIILLPGGNLRVACLQVRVRTGPDEHTHIGCAGNALGVAHVRSALDGERLTDGCLGVALGGIRDIEPALSRSTQLLALASCSVIILRRSAPRGMLPQPAKTIADKTQADKAAFLILSPFVTLNFENLPTR